MIICYNIDHAHLSWYSGLPMDTPYIGEMLGDVETFGERTKQVIVKWMSGVNSMVKVKVKGLTMNVF